MRNVFDQYSQPENKLTHALYCTLSRERAFIGPFLNWLGVSNPPRVDELKVAQQTVPGEAIASCDGDSGLPDLSIFTEEGWGVFFEMKVQSTLTADQLRRHKNTAIRYGFEEPILVGVSVEAIESQMPAGTILVQWRKIYSWFAQRMSKSFWACEFVRYMEVFEQTSIDNAYEVRGTITMFNGLRFDEQNPFHYREAKRLVRLLGDELQSRTDLHSEVGVDPEGERRSAITNERGIWDFLPLQIARGHAFTKFPHLTIKLTATNAIAAVTIPNGISGGFRTRLRELGEDGFLALMTEIEKRLRPVLAQSQGARPLLYASQRHYRSQRSKHIEDGRVDADLRTCLAIEQDDIKYQPEWIQSIYHLLIHKRSNIQCGIEIRFNYDCPIIRSPAAVGLFADAWKATRTLLDVVLDQK